MSLLVNPLVLPNPRDVDESRLFRQVSLWAALITRSLNSLSGNPALSQSGNSGSMFSTVTFAGTNAAIAIAGAIAQFVSGGTSLQTIKPPKNFGGLFFMIPTNSFSLVSGGNIQIPAGGISCIANQMVIMLFDGSNWYAGRVS